MERRKRTYPNRKERVDWLRGTLLVLTVLIVLSGLAERRKTSDFLLEKQSETSFPELEIAFDETMTEKTIELLPQSWYALQVGVFEKEETANQSSLAFQKRGAAGYVWLDGRYRVLAAAYPEKADAQFVRQQLQDQHDIESYVYELNMPALKLRLRGMQGQLDIFQAAFMHATDLGRHIQRLSVQMDRQEISATEALQTLISLKEQMEVVVIRMEQRFSEPRDRIVQELMNCLENFSKYVSSLSENESTLSMGMKLKYQVFEILANIQKVYDTLDHT